MKFQYPIALVFGATMSIAGLLTARTPLDFLVSRVPHWLDEPPLRVYWFLFLATLALPIHVALHELGHAAAGALLGFRFESLRVGWLVLRRDHGRLRAGWSAPPFAGLLGFHAAMPTTVEGVVFRKALGAAAGPATTLAVAVACRLAATRCEPPATVGSALACSVLWVGWWLGVFLTVANVLPLQFPNGYQSDGAWVLEAFRPSSYAQYLLRSVVAISSNRRPREWGVSVDEWLSAAYTSPSSRDQAWIIALMIALDTGDARAEEVLRRAFDSELLAKSRYRVAFEIEAALIDAFRGNSTPARARIEGLGNCYRHLLEASALLAEGQLDKSRAALLAWDEATANLEPTFRMGYEWAEERLRASLGGATTVG
jgi:hypothetical protein